MLCVFSLLEVFKKPYFFEINRILLMQEAAIIGPLSWLIV
jgi:hypothetical protein